MSPARALAIVSCVMLGSAAACAGDDADGATAAPDDAGSDAKLSDAQLEAEAPDAEPFDAGAAEVEAEADVEPPCTKPPCAARPIIFVHGFQGSWDDFATMMLELVVYDGRWDSFTVSGNDDPLSWKPGSFGRRQWLFSFDYYLKSAADGPGSYSAGPGRIGSNSQFVCSSPAGNGHILGDNPEYDQGFTHEYAADLARFVERVLSATGAEKVDLVGHSMGGMIVRSYLAHHGGSALTERALLLASPVRGVGLIGFLQLFPVSGPGWQALHEVAELDSGTLLSKVKFLRCGEASGDAGAFGKKLLDEEQASSPPTELYVMSGGSDVSVSYDTADHPLQKWHEVVDGASHSGMLTAKASRERVAQTLGGKY